MQHVAEVEPGDVDPDLDLAGAGRPALERGSRCRPSSTPGSDGDEPRRAGDRARPVGRQTARAGPTSRSPPRTATSSSPSAAARARRARSAAVVEGVAAGSRSTRTAAAARGARRRRSRRDPTASPARARPAGRCTAWAPRVTSHSRAGAPPGPGRRPARRPARAPGRPRRRERRAERRRVEAARGSTTSRDAVGARGARRMPRRR